MERLNMTFYKFVYSLFINHRQFYKLILFNLNDILFIPKSFTISNVFIY